MDRERGASVTVWFALTVVVLLGVVGLVVDGGAQAAGARRAETAAQAAARAGVDAAATSRLAGRPAPGDAVTAAERHLQLLGVPGRAHVEGGGLVVETDVAVPTTFLSIVGVGELQAHGSATAMLRRA